MKFEGKRKAGAGHTVYTLSMGKEELRTMIGVLRGDPKVVGTQVFRSMLKQLDSLYYEIENEDKECKTCEVKAPCPIHPLNPWNIESVVKQLQRKFCDK